MCVYSEFVSMIMSCSYIHFVLITAMLVMYGIALLLLIISLVLKQVAVRGRNVTHHHFCGAH